MNVIGAPGIAKADFEPLALPSRRQHAARMASHERQLRQHGMEREAVQSAVRVAAVVHAVACWRVRRRAGRRAHSGSLSDNRWPAPKSSPTAYSCPSQLPKYSVAPERTGEGRTEPRLKMRLAPLTMSS
jgi:hypothetical protein